MIAPPAVNDKFPPLCSVPPGKLIGALSNTSVKLVRLVKPGPTAGKTALALILRTLISLTFPNVPAKVTAVPPKSFASGNIISELGTVNVSVFGPPDEVIIPFCVMLPPAVISNPPPTLDAAISNGRLLVRLTVLLPLLFRLTAPVSALFNVNVIGNAPVVIFVIPPTVNIPVCVIAPSAITI